MVIKKSFFYFIILLLVTSCSSPYVKVFSVKENKMPENKRGVYYTLPKIGIKVNVEIIKTSYLKGPFAEYADKYLNITNVIKEENPLYEIKSALISTYTQTDSDHYYFIQYPGKKAPMQISLDQNGVLLGFNLFTNNTDKDKLTINNNYISQFDVDKFSNSFLTGNLKVDIDTSVVYEKQDTGSIKKIQLSKSLVQKSNQEKAKEAAEMIFKIQKYKMSLVSGDMETAYDPQTLRIMLDELSAKEKEYLDLFTGVSYTTTLTYTFTVIPQKDSLKSEIGLFKFDNNYGVLPLLMEQGRLVYLSLEDLTKNVTIDTLTINQPNSQKSTGIFYRIPKDFNVMVMKDNEVLTSKIITIPQLGTLVRMQKTSLLDKIFFDSKTGNINKIELKR